MSLSFEKSFRSRSPMSMRKDGLPLVAPPDPIPWVDQLKRMVMIPVFTFLAPTIFAGIYLFNGKACTLMNELYQIVSKAHADPLTKHPSFQDPVLLSKVFQTKSASLYVQHGALLYQKSEGFCGPATKQCILKSFPNYPPEQIEPQTPGPSTPDKWCASLHEKMKESSSSHEVNLTTQIVPGDDYEKFIQTLKRLNDPSQNSNIRIAINYLRPALVGFKWPMYWPLHFVLGLLGGHFSPIVAFLEKEDLVAVFDVNHKYGGTYLVPSRTLFESVRAKDIMSGKHRGLVVLKMDNSHKGDANVKKTE